MRQTIRLLSGPVGAKYGIISIPDMIGQLIEHKGKMIKAKVKAKIENKSKSWRPAPLVGYV